MKLRSYQEDALDGIREQLKEHESTLMVLPTGTGKTVVVGHLAKEYMEHGKIMMLAHREELVHQGHRHLEQITSVTPEIEMAEQHARTFGVWQSDIIVGTIQSQVAGKYGDERMRRFDPKDFSLLVIDEAHHSAAASYRRVIEYYQRNHDLKVVGITATPDRADEKALGQIFKSVAYDYELADAIEDGWLVPITQRSVYVEGLDYSSVRTTAGDLNGADLARVLEFEETLHRFASPVIDLCGDKKTLIFTATLAQAERLTEILNRHKPDSARWVHGGTPKEERRDLYPAYAGGAFQYLINVGIATEGWDEPRVECVVLARPTKSRSLYAQMLGRGTRTLPNLVEDCTGPDARKLAIRSSDKPVLEVLDFVGNAGRHRLITPSDILGGRYEDDVVERAKKNAMEKSAKENLPVNVAEELDYAEQQLEREKREAAEKARRRHLKMGAKYAVKDVDPFAVLGTKRWREKAWNEDRQPSEKMLNLLERSGVPTDGLTFTQARQLVGKIIGNHKKKLATFKQIKLLKKFGYEEADKLPFKEAGKLIDAIAKNGWKRPA